MRPFRAVCAAILIGGSAVPSLLAQKPAPPAPASRSGDRDASNRRHSGADLRAARGRGQTRRVEFLLVGIVCAAGVGIPIALGLTDPRSRRRARGR